MSARCNSSGFNRERCCLDSRRGSHPDRFEEPSKPRRARVPEACREICSRQGRRGGSSHLPRGCAVHRDHCRLSTDARIPTPKSDDGGAGDDPNRSRRRCPATFPAVQANRPHCPEAHATPEHGPFDDAGHRRLSRGLRQPGRAPECGPTHCAVAAMADVAHRGLHRAAEARWLPSRPYHYES